MGLCEWQGEELDSKHIDNRFEKQTNRVVTRRESGIQGEYIFLMSSISVSLYADATKPVRGKN